MRHWRLVVFDFDGTLCDSQRTIAEAMAAAFRAHGLDAPPVDAVRRIVGLPLEEAIRRLLPAGAGPDDAQVADAYRSAHADIFRRPGYTEPLFAEAHEVLDRLAHLGVALGIATGKSRRGLLQSLDHHRLRDRFATLQTADGGPGKPDPRMLLAAMAEVGARPEETAMVGDTTFDVEMTRAAGATAIGAGWGYHAARELRDAGAEVVLAALREVPEALARLGAFPRP